MIAERGRHNLPQRGGTLINPLFQITGLSDSDGVQQLVLIYFYVCIYETLITGKEGIHSKAERNRSG